MRHDGYTDRPLRLRNGVWTQDGKVDVLRTFQDTLRHYSALFSPPTLLTQWQKGTAVHTENDYPKLEMDIFRAKQGASRRRTYYLTLKTLMHWYVFSQGMCYFPFITRHLSVLQSFTVPSPPLLFPWMPLPPLCRCCLSLLPIHPPFSSLLFLSEFSLFLSTKR